MIRKALILALLVWSTAAAAADTTRVKSSIEEVKVFFEGAEVTRLGQVEKNKGRHVLKFDALPLSINPDRIRVEPIDGMDILTVNTRRSAAKSKEMDEKRKEWEGKIQVLEDEINLLRDRLRVLQTEEQLLITNMKIGSERESTSAEEIRAAADFYRQRLNELGDKRLAINRDIRKKQEDLKDAFENLNRVSAGGLETQSEVFVTVDCKKYVSGSIRLQYFADLAGWKPSYDLRVNKITEPLNVIYHGTVFQSTGEDWNDVKLILSSANPSISNTAPQLETWYINRGEQKYNSSGSAGIGGISGFVTDAKTSEPLPYANVSVFQNGRLISGANTNPDGSYTVKPLKTGYYEINASYVGYADQSRSVNISEGETTPLDMKLQTHSELQEVAMADQGRRDNRFSGNAAKAKAENTRQQPFIQFDMEMDDAAPKMELSSTDITYEVDERMTVKSNGKDHSTQIKEVETPATFVYRAIPKLDLDAFLIARLSEWSELELLSGETRIYYEGAYVGSAELKSELSIDTLEISLGRDESIKISREKDRKIDDKRIIGNNTKKTVAWDITIRNNKDTPIDFELYDQYPLSEYKSISIDNLGHGDAKHDEKTGELRWDFSIPASGKQVKSFSYSVKYPSSGKVME